MEAAANGKLRIGPAGWSYEDWKGIVYPAGMPRSLHPLEFLCEHFDTIEVNSSFYRPPNASYCATWIKKVHANPEFKFTVKLWERFTHKRDSWPEDAAVVQFVSGILPLAEAGLLGAVLIQFPWSFRRTPENRTWLARVLDTFSDYPLSVEVRHATWDLPSVYEGLEARGAAFCNIDQPLFKDSLEATEAITAPLAYVRLHGRNHEDWFREDAGRDERYNYLYSEDELKPWVQKVQAIRRRASEIYAITNNHYRGQAVVNAFELQSMLGVSKAPPPEHLIAAYPRLRGLLARGASEKGS